ncbi:hypothetical protein PV726_31270 [Streptomyces europaeiscabiei]|uniref:hypothetical protein n=1 Tax=Streptomyces europaeiscabiei TaxID=146819 RepID=UPI0029BC086C|nr:hypothetical protein [Streptomyces europaeiscabiei]MDX3694735.1 hypothetical protein [Streptomyces europaeiscabiei]
MQRQATGGEAAADAEPIYADLVRERGDVPAEARRVADRAEQDLKPLLDFRLAPLPTIAR